MYAILVKEPGGETESFILGTAASTPKAAINLMFTRAEEFISEQLEVNAEVAEDYTIETRDHLLVVVFNPADNNKLIMVLEATAIDEVV